MTKNQYIQPLQHYGVLRVPVQWHRPVLSPLSCTTNVVHDRVRGMCYGLALGDALGRSSESLSAAQRLQIHGLITTYPEDAHGLRVGFPTDDTQMSFWLLDHLLERTTIVPDSLTEMFATRHVEHSGRTMRQFQAQYAAGEPWYTCGIASAGNGALMRISPVVLPYINNPSETLWDDALLCGMLTHNDAASHGACQTMVAWLWAMMDASQLPAPRWWLDTYIQHAMNWECGPMYDNGAGSKDMLWRMVARRVVQAYAKQWTTAHFCAVHPTGPYLLDTMSAVLFILMRYAHNPREAVLQSIQHTWDNDTIASIVACVLGAYYGMAPWQGEWVEGLSGCVDHMEDYGHVQASVERAVACWG